jgi:hypothetical protein
VTLAENIIARFAGRRDLIAVGAGDTFAPEQCAPTAKRIESDHLGGTCCLGFYVLDEQSRCCCTAADFDNKPHAPDPLWREHAEQFYYALLQFGLSPLVEISQSGQAAHVWLFLSEPTDAWIPRAFWRALARRLDAKCPEIYPRQDRHEDKSKAVGNLIRYPLWNRSAFVDVENDWTPIDPVEAIENARLTTGTDLKLIAFQAGLGELSPDPRVELAAIDIGGGAILPIRVARMIADPGTMLGKRTSRCLRDRRASRSRQVRARDPMARQRRPTRCAVPLHLRGNEPRRNREAAIAQHHGRSARAMGRSVGGGVTQGRERAPRERG